MRVVDMATHHVIKCGVTWPYSSTPNCKQMITQLERNEALVTWLQPNSGGVIDQFPAIQIKDHYYTMSLRMMKAVWRHVRLKKNFVNRETIPHVGVKLRIPEVLLVEKMRTQQRFNVSHVILKQRTNHPNRGAHYINPHPPRPGDARVGVRPQPQGDRAQAHGRGPAPAHPPGGPAPGGDHVLHRAGGRVAHVHSRPAPQGLSAVVHG